MTVGYSGVRGGEFGKEEKESRSHDVTLENQKGKERPHAEARGPGQRGTKHGRNLTASGRKRGKKRGHARSTVESTRSPSAKEKKKNTQILKEKEKAVWSREATF